MDRRAGRYTKEVNPLVVVVIVEQFDLPLVEFHSVMRSQGMANSLPFSGLTHKRIPSCIPVRILLLSGNFFVDQFAVLLTG